MAFEDNQCPCGGTKDRQTLICPACVVHVSQTTDRFELDHWQDKTFTPDARRRMAIRLLSIARKRTLRLPLSFSA